MANVTCSRCGNSAQGLEFAPMGGQLGETIHTQVCASCWHEWLGQQMLHINHYGLQMGDPEDRKRLTVVMKEFLNLAPA